ncbi:MAG: isoprenylcysteine carboxylmethyltransferase family protein [Dehalococcoidia bacterium]|nr:isoprenylcysteine carboxylmethyltransferase family protein [Dehalococcoidia bacterium]
MLYIGWMKILTAAGMLGFLGVWIRYAKLSKVRKPDDEMPTPHRPLALVTIVFDRIFIVISVIYASIFLLWGYSYSVLYFSCVLDLSLQLTGIVLSIVGLFISWWAIVSFGEFNEPRWAHLKHGHRVVKVGPYRYIRHPQYAAKLLASLGLFLFFKEFLFLFIFLFSVLLFYFQAKSEEKLLTQVFGEDYIIYQSTTGMFLPRLLAQRTGDA